jgi:hypothetical protein
MSSATNMRERIAPAPVDFYGRDNSRGPL